MDENDRHGVTAATWDSCRGVVVIMRGERVRYFIPTQSSFTRFKKLHNLMPKPVSMSWQEWAALVEFRLECRHTEVVGSWEQANALYAWEIFMARAESGLGTLCDWTGRDWLIESKVWFMRAHMYQHALACEKMLAK